jgi:hypothetical protein
VPEGSSSQPPNPGVAVGSFFEFQESQPILAIGRAHKKTTGQGRWYGLPTSPAPRALEKPELPIGLFPLGKRFLLPAATKARPPSRAQHYNHTT